MPSETLELLYSAKPRGNRRRPKPHTLHQIITRLVVLLVAIMLLIAVLMKLGVIHETARPIYVA